MSARRSARRRLIRCVAAGAVALVPATVWPDSFPTLRPIDELLSAAPAPRLSTESGDALAARATRLEARAEALRRRAVIDAATQARADALAARIAP